MHQQTNGFTQNLLFFLAGAMIGGAAAALATPYSGPRMRRIVRRKIESGGEQLSSAAETVRDAYGDLRARGEGLLRGAEKMFART